MRVACNAAANSTHKINPTSQTLSRFAVRTDLIFTMCNAKQLGIFPVAVKRRLSPASSSWKRSRFSQTAAQATLKLAVPLAAVEPTCSTVQMASRDPRMTSDPHSPPFSGQRDPRTASSSPDAEGLPRLISLPANVSEHDQNPAPVAKQARWSVNVHATGSAQTSAVEANRFSTLRQTSLQQRSTVFSRLLRECDDQDSIQQRQLSILVQLQDIQDQSPDSDEILNALWNCALRTTRQL
jgi:hypothetical protein